MTERLRNNGIAAVVVTYFPPRSSITSLNALSAWVDHLVVIDNTPHPQTQAPLFPKDNISIISNGENLGLAKALNLGMNIAGNKGCCEIFLFDQDSCPTAQLINQMIAFKSSLDDHLRRNAVCVPNVIDRNSATYVRFPVLSKFLFRHMSCGGRQVVQKKSATMAITSGTLISLSLYKRIGPFANDYFIDFIDNEYCLRLAGMGGSVVVNCGETMEHAIGNRMVQRWMGLTIKPNHHNSVRRYYISRNGVRTAILYFKQYPSFTLLLMLRFIHELLSIVLFEKRKSHKIRAFLIGMLDGLRGKMGACPHKL